MRVLVTAGPTREPLDPVRFLSNRSSGRMGYAIAAALRADGHEVALVSGPVELPAPPGVARTSVETARQMLAACESVWERCDALYAVAAVADYRPAEESVEKLKRSAGEGRVLRLVENPDVVATLAARKAGRRVIGFALESRDGETEARRKMQAKGLDFVCLNGPEAQGAAEAALVLLGRDGSRRLLGPLPKEELARALVSATLPPADAPG